MTILNITDFTDIDVRDCISNLEISATDGYNIYLSRADLYYGKLLRDFSIDSTDIYLADPVIFDIKTVLIHWVEVDVFKDLIGDSRAPFDGQTIIPDKYINKLRIAKTAYKEALDSIDINSFYNEVRSTDTRMITKIGRR